MRNLYWMATALAVAVIAPLGPSARAQHEHAEHFLKCAKVCADCQLQCDSCFKHCLTLLADGKKEHAKTAQLCADCGECCKTGAQSDGIPKYGNKSVVPQSTFWAMFITAG